jgi:hypothetical protein
MKEVDSKRNIIDKFQTAFDLLSFTNFTVFIPRRYKLPEFPTSWMTKNPLDIPKPVVNPFSIKGGRR